MKIVFKVKEDDPRNPGVIADCTGDNAGDSVGPTADGFETYGVTGVALISFIVLAVPDAMVQVKLLVWIFLMRVMLVLASGGSYLVSNAIAKVRHGAADKFQRAIDLRHARRQPPQRMVGQDTVALKLPQGRVKASEFLAVLSIVLLSIVFRQNGSPESKEVEAPHSQTGGP